MRFSVEPLQVPIKLSRHVTMEWQIMDSVNNRPLALFTKETAARAYMSHLNKTDPLRSNHAIDGANRPRG